MSDSEVLQRLNAIEAQNFKAPGDLQRFLAASGETNTDLLFRVRVDELSVKLRQKAEAAGKNALDAYTKAFKAKWRSRTSCAAGYVVAECRNATT